MNFGAVDRWGAQQRKNKQIIAFYGLKTTILEAVKCSRFSSSSQCSSWEEDRNEQEKNHKNWWTYLSDNLSSRTRITPLSLKTLNAKIASSPLNSVSTSVARSKTVWLHGESPSTTPPPSPPSPTCPKNMNLIRWNRYSPLETKKDKNDLNHHHYPLSLHRNTIHMEKSTSNSS